MTSVAMSMGLCEGAVIGGEELVVSRLGRGGRLGEEGRRSLGSVSCEVVCLCGSGGCALGSLEGSILVSFFFY